MSKSTWSKLSFTKLWSLLILTSRLMRIEDRPNATSYYKLCFLWTINRALSCTYYIQSGLPKVSYLAPPEASPATRGRIVICKIGCKRNSYSPIWFAHWYLIWKTRVCQLHFFIGLQNKWDWFDATLYFFKFKTKTGSKRGQKVAGRGDEHDHWPFWWFKDRFCI